MSRVTQVGRAEVDLPQVCLSLHISSVCVPPTEGTTGLKRQSLGESGFAVGYIQVQISPLPLMSCVALGLDFTPCEMGIAASLTITVMMEWLPQVKIPGTCQVLKKWWPVVFFPSLDTQL